MKAEDIIWGGNNKCVVRLNNDIGLEPGTLVSMEYDYIKELYSIRRDMDRVDITATETVLEMLNSIYLTGSSPTTMVWVVDKEENLDYIIEIKVFQDEISFGKLNAIEIKIGDEIIEKMRARDKENPIAYLNNAFKYGFILRYPKGKEYITGIIFEPWHYRYVGKEAAADIRNQDLTLEEYLEELELY